MSKSLQAYLQVIISLLLIVLITFFKLQFPDILGTATPFLLYTAVVAFSTIYAGWQMGVVITFLSLLPIIYYFLTPVYSFSVEVRQSIQIISYLFEDLLVIGMSYALKKANKKNIDAENMFKLLTEKACDLLVLRDVNGKAFYVSPKVKDLYGYTTEEYANLSIEDMVAPEFESYFRQNMKEVSETPNAYRVVRIQARTKDGSLRWMEGDVYNFLEQPGINAIVSHIKDITERVNLERQKDDFIGIASHELKTPLANIKGFVSLADRSARDKPEMVQPFLQKAFHNINRLQKLVSDLLDISKINSGQLTYNFEDFSFSELLKETVASLKMHHDKHEFVINCPDEISVAGDRFRLEQVLVNLLENAVKYSPDVYKVLVKAEISNRFLVVSIQDFGIGISEDHISKIFNRFYRVDNTSTKYQGLGLGLFIASEIIKKHKGSFWLNSKLGEGSTFSFLLPLDNNITRINKTDNKSFYEASYISIKYNEKQHWIEADWISYQTLETVQEGCLNMLSLVKATGVSKVLNNNVKVKGNWSEAADWGSSTWFPMMEKAGIKHFAWIQSPERFSQLAALKSTEIKNGKINIRFFEDSEKAVKWLKEVE